MKRTFSFKPNFIIGCVLTLLALCATAQAQTTSFTYQGSLTFGGSLATGSYDLQFKLYDQLAGGSLQGSPSTVTVFGVAVTAGVFSVELDFGATAFPGATRYLEISVRPAGNGSFTTLSPRQQITSTPYAIRSLSAASADAATTATSATTATNFSGSLAGDVTGTQGATVVSMVSGVTASNVASGATAANNATDANLDNTIVKRDTTGSFSAALITATGFSGSGANLTNLNATNITSGTLSDSLLSSNIATLSGDQTFTGGKIFSSLNGLLATGTFNSGTIPATGAGQRMMWYPKKIAFRAGSVSGTEWDDANVGLLSVAMGNQTKASGNSSFAVGNQTTASATASVALGSFTTAGGSSSFAMGSNTTASGSRTTALGAYASTNGNDGSFVYGDNSTTTLLNATATNQFNVRASGGLRLFASSDTTDETKPGLFINGTTGNTQINGNLTVSGAISGGSFSNVALLNLANTFAGNQTINGDLTVSGSISGTFSGNGGGITNLNASNIAGGTLSDSLLSSNIATLTGNQTFTGNKIFSGANGLLATGTFNSGSIPATGEGVRMMWYPNKAAFRAGQVSGTQWDDANVGSHSVALGSSTRASGQNSFAAGISSTASNYASVAMGENSTASGESTIALGNTATASGNFAIALGDAVTASGSHALALGEKNVASGQRGVALGSVATASGNYSTALGHNASTNGKDGSFVYGDNSTSSTISAAADNQFAVRAAGGYSLFASSDTSDTTKPGLFISGTTGNTQINGDLTVSGSISGTISGSSITSLNATNISSGTLSDSRLSSNVALLSAANTFTVNQMVNANLIQSGSLVQFTPTNGFVALGTEGSGSIPATGAGIRMMWYPNKYAFRAGKLDGSGFHGETYWDDSNIGSGSFAFGYNTLASGDRTFATGYESHATGSDSIAIGRFSSASASDAIALGGCTASGQNSTCLIDGTASADYSLAVGFRTTASGDYSTAVGQRASTNGQKGSFVYGDSSSTGTISATTTNQFVVRAQNMWFGTNNSPTATSGRFLETSTGAYLTTGGTWTNSSSRALKTNFAAVNSREVLRKVLQLPIQTWNYKAEDARVRHIGAISQDFNRLFGFGDSAETISTVDADGVAMAAIQGLHEELKDRDAKIERLEQQLKGQQTVIDGLRKLLCAQNPQADVCRNQ